MASVRLAFVFKISLLSLRSDNPYYFRECHLHYNMATIDLGGLPSWIMVVLIGFAIVLLLSNPVGWTIMFAGLGLGAIYFLLDLRNKI